MNYLISLGIGLLVGALYAVLDFRSPAPPAIALVGLPPGDFPTPIFDVVLKGLHIAGSIVGTRADLQEALDFAGEGLVKATIHPGKLDDINQILDQMRAGQIEGRIVLEM